MGKECAKRSVGSKSGKFLEGQRKRSATDWPTSRSMYDMLNV